MTNRLTLPRLIRLTITLAAVATLFFLSAVFWIENQYTQYTSGPSTFPYSQNKIWSHSGYYVKHSRNSIKAFKAALHLGAGGIEVDIYYDKGLQSFVTSHDKPYELVDGNIQTLSEVLEAFGTKTYYWLDLKNLPQLSLEDREEAALHLVALSEKLSLRNHIIIEAKDATFLSSLTTYDIATLYHIRVHHDEPFPIRWLKTLHIKWTVAKNKVSAISIDHARYGNDFPFIFKGIDIFLSTVNDKLDILEYSKLRNVRVILTDKDFFNALSHQ